MTILKAYNGKEINTDEFIGKPYGAFTDYIRSNIDSMWGKVEDPKDADKKPVFNVEFKAVKTVSCYTNLEIEADTLEEVKEKAKREIWRRTNDFDWDNGVDAEISDIEIEDIKQLDEDEITIERKGYKNENDEILV